MRCLGIVLVLGLLVVSSALGADDAKLEEKRAAMLEGADDVLARLYAVQPSAKRAIGGSAGYAVFTNFGMKILVAGGGSGRGVAIDNASKAATYMKMVEIQAGLGMGIKKTRLVWVFETKPAFDRFVNSGWELGAQATAAAKAGKDGVAFAGAVAIAPGVWLYQLTDDGLALELTVKGTKYFKDSSLN